MASACRWCADRKSGKHRGHIRGGRHSFDMRQAYRVRNQPALIRSADAFDRNLAGGPDVIQERGAWGSEAWLRGRLRGARGGDDQGQTRDQCERGQPIVRGPTIHLTHTLSLLETAGVIEMAGVAWSIFLHRDEKLAAISTGIRGLKSEVRSEGRKGPHSHGLPMRCTCCAESRMTRR